MRYKTELLVQIANGEEAEDYLPLNRRKCPYPQTKKSRRAAQKCKRTDWRGARCVHNRRFRRLFHSTGGALGTGSRANVETGYDQYTNLGPSYTHPTNRNSSLDVESIFIISVHVFFVLLLTILLKWRFHCTGRILAKSSKRSTVCREASPILY